MALYVQINLVSSSVDEAVDSYMLMLNAEFRRVLCKRIFFGMVRMTSTMYFHGRCVASKTTKAFLDDGGLTEAVELVKTCSETMHVVAVTNLFPHYNQSGQVTGVYFYMGPCLDNVKALLSFDPTAENFPKPSAD